MSYRVHDLVYANQWVTMPDGYVVKFVEQFANVPDKYVDKFRRNSNYNVQGHTEEAEEPKVEEKVEKKDTFEVPAKAEEPKKEEDKKVTGKK